MLVGLTGGIACGKTTVAQYFARLGAVVIDADNVARSVVAPGTPGLDQIKATFGVDLIKPSGELDRAALGRLIFSDADVTA